MKKTAYIKELNGIVISDPWYEKDVWCRYECNNKEKGWQLQYISEMKHDNEYDFDYIVFSMSLGRNQILSNIHLKDETILYPKSLSLKEYEIGMDSARFCCCSKSNFEVLGESMSLSTGTDGLLGNVYEFKKAEDENPVAIVFIGSIDPDFITEQSLFEHFCAGFDAIPIEKEIDTVIKNSKREQLDFNKENTIENLIHIGLGCQKDFKPTTWKYANKLMGILEKENLVVPYDYGRGKGKWKIAEEKNNINDLIKKTTKLDNSDINKIVKEYHNYRMKKQQGIDDMQQNR